MTDDNQPDPSTPYEPVTTLEDLATLNEAELVAGYWSGREDEPNPGTSRSRSFWHGWCSGMVYSGHMPVTPGQEALALAVQNRRVSKHAPDLDEHPTHTQMIISLDYDETITKDVGLWSQFVRTARTRGHTVHIVTMRYPHEPVAHDFGCRVFYTSRQLKKPFMYRQDIHVDVWIDDSPDMINGGGTILNFGGSAGGTNTETGSSEVRVPAMRQTGDTSVDAIDSAERTKDHTGTYTGSEPVNDKQD